MSDSNENIFGLLASFKKAPEVYHAAEKVRDAGFKHWDVFTPYPMHGLDNAMGLKRSNVPVLTLMGGLTGFITGILVTWYMNSYDYPLVVGGKPFWSPVYPFPIMYELTILLAAFGTFFGMFITNFLPQHYHPVFNTEKFLRSSDDTFFIVIEKKDPLFDVQRTMALLENVGATDITIVEK